MNITPMAIGQKKLLQQILKGLTSNRNCRARPGIKSDSPYWPAGTDWRKMTAFSGPWVARQCLTRRCKVLSNCSGYLSRIMIAKAFPKRSAGQFGFPDKQRNYFSLPNCFKRILTCTPVTLFLPDSLILLDTSSTTRADIDFCGWSFLTKTSLSILHVNAFLLLSDMFARQVPAPIE